MGHEVQNPVAENQTPHGQSQPAALENPQCQGPGNDAPTHSGQDAMAPRIPFKIKTGKRGVARIDDDPFETGEEQNQPDEIQTKSSSDENPQRAWGSRRFPTARGKHGNVVVTAIARALLAFMWAIAKEVPLNA